jgi:hypothetical protein
MRTLKDVLDVPLEDLRTGIKQWVDYSCKFWDDWLSEYNAQKAVKAGDEEDKPKETEETAEDKPKEAIVPTDVTAVIEYNKAIVEKYQTSGAESLLKHLVAQLAKERGVNLEDTIEDKSVEELLTEELKSVIDVSPEKQEMLRVPQSERAEYVAKKIIVDHPELMKRIYDGDKEVIKEFDKKAIEIACGTVDEADLKFALRSLIKMELMIGETTDA